MVVSSIHPQGWVPIETAHGNAPPYSSDGRVAFTPKGGCPLKLVRVGTMRRRHRLWVAFTPKGGCPLKLRSFVLFVRLPFRVAFTPKGGCPLKQPPIGWCSPPSEDVVAFTPKGGCPLKQFVEDLNRTINRHLVAFTPKGGCPLKPLLDNPNTR